MNKKQTSVLAALAAIALNNKEGFTVSAATLQPITTGYVIDDGGEWVFYRTLKK